MKKYIYLFVIVVLVNTKAVSQDINDINQMIFPGTHKTDWGLELGPLEPEITLEASYLFYLISEEDSSSKVKLSVRTINDVAVKTTILTKGKKQQKQLFSTIEKSFSTPTLIAENILVDVYKWEYPQGVQNEMQCNKLNRKCWFKSQLIKIK